MFWWSLKSGQYEDLEGPGHRILMDDDTGGVQAKSGSVDPDLSTKGGK
jgi:nitrogen fixation-related uncharacterized protein